MSKNMQGISTGIIEGYTTVNELRQKRDSLEEEYENLCRNLGEDSVKSDSQSGELLLEETAISELQKEARNLEQCITARRNATRLLHNEIAIQRNMQNEELNNFEKEMRELTNRFKIAPKLYHHAKLQEEIFRYRAQNINLKNEMENLSKELEQQCYRFGIVLPECEENGLANDALNRLVRSVIEEQRNDPTNSDEQLIALNKELDKLEKATCELRQELQNLHT